MITVNVEGYPSALQDTVGDTDHGLWRLLRSKLSYFFGETLTKTTLQQKLIYLWSSNRREDNLLANSDVVIRPRIADIGIADNHKYDVVEERGYAEAFKRLGDWLRLIPEDS